MMPFKLDSNQLRLVAGLLVSGLFLLVLAVLYFLYPPYSIQVQDAETGQPLSAEVVALSQSTVLASTLTVNGSVSLWPGLSRATHFVVRKAGYQAVRVQADGTYFLVKLQKIVERPVKLHVLLVTLRKPLVDKYGRDESQRVLEAAERLAFTIEQSENLSSRVILLDDAEDGNKYGFPQVQDYSAESILNSEQALVRSQAPRYVILIGGPRVIPFQAIPNPLALAPEAEAFAFLLAESPQVESDNPYGVTSGSASSVPSVSVGRIPDDAAASASGADAFIRLLDNAASLHIKRLELGSPALWLSASSYSGYYTRGFFAGSEQVLSPPSVAWTETGYVSETLVRLEQTLVRPSLFILLHGNAPLQPQVLAGRPSEAEGEYVDSILVDPEVADKLVWRGRVVLADSCWAGSPERLREESILLKALEGGAVGFVGSTLPVLSLASSRAEGVGGDKMEFAGVSNSLLYILYSELLQGQTVGEAFRKAKEQISLFGGAPEQFTLLEFAWYGDPTLRFEPAA